MSSTPKLSKQVSEALAVAWELSGNPKLSDAAARMVMAELGRHPEAAVLRAIERATREVSGRLSLAAIIQRIDDGRPSADEAWAQVGAASEDDTLVTTTEAMQAWGTVAALLEEDPQGARMAFRDAYNRIVTEARGVGTPVRVHVSLGHDKGRRQGVLMRAVQSGQLDADHAAGLLGVPAAELMGHARPALPATAQARPVAQLIGQVAASKGPPPCGEEGCDGWKHGDEKCPRWRF